jgi:hypothetical protein
MTATLLRTYRVLASPRHLSSATRCHCGFMMHVGRPNYPPSCGTPSPNTSQGVSANHPTVGDSGKNVKLPSALHAAPTPPNSRRSSQSPHSRRSMCQAGQSANTAAAASARWTGADCEVDCQPLGLTPFQSDAGEQTQAMYLRSWTATDSAGQSGKSQNSPSRLQSPRPWTTSGPQDCGRHRTTPVAVSHRPSSEAVGDQDSRSLDRPMVPETKEVKGAAPPGGMPTSQHSWGHRAPRS